MSTVGGVSPAAGGVTSSQSNSPTSNSTSSSNALLNQSTSQFLQLLVAQLQNQDPLNPVSQSDFTSQLAQLSQVESLQTLNTNISQLLQLQGLSQGAALIGKTVSYTPSGSTTPQSGVVSAVNTVNGQVQLQVGKASVPLSQVTGVTGSS